MEIGPNEPNDIEIEGLPRALVGGLRRSAVQELLRRVQWEYSQLFFEYRKLKEAGEAGQRADEPRAEPVAALAAPEVEPAAEAAEAPRREPDELARLALAAARRTARELRESARRDCELMLKKARLRVVELEHEFERAKASRRAELAELDAMMDDVRAQMRAALQTIRPEAPAGSPADVDQREATNGLLPAGEPAESQHPAAEAPPGPPFVRSEL